MPSHALEVERRQIAPQPRQEQFLSSNADIAIYGGAAGGGKSFALLLEVLRHYHRPGFFAVIFRRQGSQVTREGGLWDESENLYPYVGASGSRYASVWTFPSGARLRFAHLEHEKDKFTWMGSQIALLGFDELTHFTESQFWYLLSRNRSSCGIRPYVRATCNPDPDSFVARMIEWWIDQNTGLPVRERGGVIRWFARSGNNLVWADSADRLMSDLGKDCSPKTLTFIPANISDNQELLRRDPGYMANLKALPLVERRRLLEGDWKVRATAGMYFRRQWFKMVDAVPADATRVRYWDRASTDASAGGDPDWTVGLKMARNSIGQYFIEHVTRLRGTPATVETAIKNTASQDGKSVMVGIEKDPGQAGVAEADYYVRSMAGYTIRLNPATRDKETRAKPVSAQTEHGNMFILRGAWNEVLLDELENFPEGAHDDQVDALSGAFEVLSRAFTLYMV